MAELNLQLRQAIAAARAGKVPQAKLLAESALVEEPEDVNALLLLSALADSQEEQIDYLHRILARDPDHAIARKRLAQLNGAVEADSEVEVDASEDGDEAIVPDVEAPSEALEVSDVEATTPLESGDPALTVEVDSVPDDAGIEPIDEADSLSEVVELEAEEWSEHSDEPVMSQEAVVSDPLAEQLETPFSVEPAERPIEESPVAETDMDSEEVELSQTAEFDEPSPEEFRPFEHEELPPVFARKVEALLPEEMAKPPAEAVETQSDENEEPRLEEKEANRFAEMTQPAFEPEEDLPAIEDLPEPDFEDMDLFPSAQEPDLDLDDSMETLIAHPPEMPGEAESEQFLSELHEFPVEDLRKPAALDEDQMADDVGTEAPELEDAPLFEPVSDELGDLVEEDTAPSEDEPAERPFLAVTAPLAHDVVESPPEAREGLAAELDNELFEEEADRGHDSPPERDSSETDQLLAASAAAMASQQDNDFGNEDVFASLVEDVAESESEDVAPDMGFEPVAESDIPEWLREAEDSSLSAGAVETEATEPSQEPAELNDIPAWLLDDGDEEWLESAAETRVEEAYAEETIDTETTPDVATETLAAAAASEEDYSDDELDAALATVIDDEVAADSIEVDRGMQESAQVPFEEANAAAEDEKAGSKVSTRVLEIFLIVLVGIAVIVLAALAVVLFNPFS